MTLRFLRNKVVEVEPRADGNIGVSWRLTDDLYKIEVGMVVQVSDFEIIEATAKLDRFVPDAWKDAEELIEDIEGITIGAGLRKIVGGLLSECPPLSHAVLESCNAVILHFTRPLIEAGETITDPEKKLESTRAMLAANPRLVRSCISFQDDSPIMKGLNL